MDNEAEKQLKPTLAGFEKIQRYWDPQFNSVVAKIKPGEFYVTKESEAVVTVLGSCIAACIRDKETKIGGMNHFMLPLQGNVYDDNVKNKIVGNAARYGNWAMEYLINGILKFDGKRRNLEIKLFGGSNIAHSSTAVGEKNINFALDYIYDENLQLCAKDIGGAEPRLVVFWPQTGRVQMKKLPLTDSKSEQLIVAEKSYMNTIETEQNKPTDDNIELF